MSLLTKLTKPFLSGAKTPLLVPTCISVGELAGQYTHRLFPASESAPLTVPQKLVIDIVKSNMPKKAYRSNLIPRLPSVIPRLLHSLRDPASSARDYVEIIRRDPTMSVAVLKLANSVYFNPIGKKINGIDRAVVKLGIVGLRLVLSAAVMQPIIQQHSAYFPHTGQKLWQHSLECAVVCECIAKSRKTESYKAYLVGLIHDIGKITVFSELCRQFTLHDEKHRPGHQAFAPVVALLAPAASYWIARDWELPTELCKALAEQTNLQSGVMISPYGQLLFQANLVSEAYACIWPHNPTQAKALLAELNLPGELYQTLQQLARDV